jgi:hypothetical protein
MSGASDVATRPVAPYWIDELGRKHEGSVYSDSDARAMTLEHEGHPVRLLMPAYTPPMDIRVTASAGDLLFLLGERLDEEDEDETIIPGGDGIVLVAGRHKSLSGTYWLAIWHCLYPEAARRLVEGE